MLLLDNIIEGKKRFGELQRALEGISSKTLSIRLQELEEAGIISKKSFAEVPLHVEYTMTEKGKSLGLIFDQMAKLGEKN